MPNFIDLTGQKFERLTVIGRAERSRTGKPRWLCRCECGGTAICMTGNLRSGISRSCGCLQREAVLALNSTKTTHGHTTNSVSSRTYKCWCSMKDRCARPTHPAWKNYGGRGIRVCDRWLNSFENFLADMGEMPEGLSLDRIDNDGDYEPSNCRWATAAEQNANRRNPNRSRA